MDTICSTRPLNSPCSTLASAYNCTTKARLVGKEGREADFICMSWRGSRLLLSRVGRRAIQVQPDIIQICLHLIQIIQFDRDKGKNGTQNRGDCFRPLSSAADPEATVEGRRAPRGPTDALGCAGVPG